MRISDWSSDVCSSDLVTETNRQPVIDPIGCELERPVTFDCRRDLECCGDPIVTNVKLGAVSNRLTKAVIHQQLDAGHVLGRDDGILTEGPLLVTGHPDNPERNNHARDLPG